MLTFLWLLFGAVSYIVFKRVAEGEPLWRIWTVSDIFLMVLLTILGPLGVAMLGIVLLVVYVCENYDQEIFRFGKKDEDDE